jgi:ankyrin repeat protein
MGRRDIAEFLLDAGAPLTVTAAAMLGRTDDVVAFLDADPALANARGAHGISILFHAAMSGNTAVPALLLARGGGDRIDEALHGAILYGHTGMVAWLLDHGVTNLDAPDYDGKTPLRVAVERGHTAIADLLRQRGATEGAAPAQTAG